MEDTISTDEPWRLWLTETSVLVAELWVDVSLSDFPFLGARVVAGPGLEQVAHLFAQELRYLDADDESEGWDDAYSAIRAATRLTYPDGRPVAEYLLHIDRDQAWWRWSDKPFS